MSEAIGQLPAGWRRVRLSDVCEAKTGIRDPSVQPAEPFTYLDISSIDNIAKRVTAARRLLGRDAPSRARQIVRAGDVIVSTTRPNLNAVALLGPQYDGQICSTGFCVLRANPELDSEYLFAFVCSVQFVNALAELVKGALYPSVTDAQVRAREILLPPLEEQRRIAAVLRAKLVELERGRVALAAQLAASEALPAAHLRAVFDSEEAHKWPVHRLREVLRIRSEVVHPSDHPRGEARFVGLEHVEPHTGRRVGSVEFKLEKMTGRRTRFYSGDIVYGYLRPYLNKLWQAEFDGYCSVDQYVFTVRSDVADPDFVALFMRSPLYLRRAPVQLTPGQLPRIRSAEVASVEINLPDIATQRRLAAELKERVAAAAALHRALRAQAADLAIFNAALLREAFAGRL